MGDILVTSARFISLEGGDGVGKSTHARFLADAFEAQGYQTLVTREPGGTKGAEKVRALLKEGDLTAWLPMSEVLLLYAARYDHVEKVIKPALEANVWVICDRFSDSTMAYQCYAHALPIEKIDQIHWLVLGNFFPDITFFLDNEAKETYSRVERRAIDIKNPCAMDRVERLGVSFQERLIQGYRELAKKYTRIHTIDARQEKPKVHEDLCKRCNEVFGISLNPVEVPPKKRD
jgi:dTMP kinase